MRALAVLVISISAAMAWCAAGEEVAPLKVKPFRDDLSELERWVMFERGTERPFTGKYVDHFEKGIYVCNNCGIPLYRSEDKFHSGCGWPSFDDEIPGAVRRSPDPDGVRTEISCAYCGAHLGHVFEGEGFTPKNVRHCVNSASMRFLPQGERPRINRIFLAGGCFWGVEHLMKRHPYVVDTRVGYMGGHVPNPTYKMVCTGRTGHLETVEVIYQGDKPVEEILRYFFEIHDFSQEDGQGPDIGPQYLSAIFYTDEEQREVAERLIQRLKEMGHKVATQLREASTFYLAEDYHQDYYDKTGEAPYCHRWRKVF